MVIVGELLEEHGVTMPPVPVKRLVKSYARLFYFNSNMDPDFAQETGFTVLRNDNKYDVYLNGELVVGRDCFTLAHELGHIMLKHLLFFEPYYLDVNLHHYLDREADQFATELLMPANWIKAACRFTTPTSSKNIGRLKNIFGVSWQALMIRLDQLSLQPYKESLKILKEGER